MIQIDDPPIKGGAAAAHRLQAQEEVEFAIDVVNRELEGLEDVEVWLHICWGSPGAQGRDPSKRVYTEETIDSLFRVKADVLNIESKSVDHAVLPFFKKYKGNLPMKIAPGFVSHRTTQVESVTEVAAEVRAALEFIDAEDLILASDCGFGRQGVSRSIATYKAAARGPGCRHRPPGARRRGTRHPRGPCRPPDRPVPARADPRGMTQSDLSEAMPGQEEAEAAASTAAGPPSDIGIRRQTLQVEGLVVRFGGVTPVDHMSLTISPGDIVGLIGPNGAGKSTLIDTISGSSSRRPDRCAWETRTSRAGPCTSASAPGS